MVLGGRRTVKLSWRLWWILPPVARAMQLFEQDIGTLKRSLSNKSRRFSRISEIALVTHRDRPICCLAPVVTTSLQTLRQWLILALCGVCAPPAARSPYCFYNVNIFGHDRDVVRCNWSCVFLLLRLRLWFVVIVVCLAKYVALRRELSK